MSALKSQTAYPAWAFLVLPPSSSEPLPPAPPGGFSVPGSKQHYSAAEIKNQYRAVDWFPERRAGAPRGALEGRPGGAQACGFCHLPDGQGRPENATLAGLPAAYIVEQVKAMHGGIRKGAKPDWRSTRLMTEVAKAAREDDVEAAARWFHTQRYTPVLHLIEAREIDAVVPGNGLSLHKSGGGREPLGDRIVEIANDQKSFALRDNRPGYTIYVPEGSIARGRMLAQTGGGGRFAACASCHGAGLKGGLGPALAGHYPAYLFRQLLGFSNGGRQGAAAAPMIQAAKTLKTDEMIALAAYAASLKP